MAKIQMGIDDALDVLAGIIRNENISSALAMIDELRPQIIAAVQRAETQLDLITACKVALPFLLEASSGMCLDADAEIKIVRDAIAKAEGLTPP